MIAIDEITRTPKNVVVKGGTDRLMVDASGVTLTVGDISVDMSATNAKLDTLIARSPDVSNQWQVSTTIPLNTTSPITLKANVAAVRNYLVSIQCSCAADSGERVYIIKSGSTVIHKGVIQVSNTDDRRGIISFPQPLKGGVNESLTVELTANLGTALYVNAQGFAL